MKVHADFRRGESICRLSWKVFADFGGNNPRLSFEGPNLVFQDEINCLDFRYWSIYYISNSKGQRAMFLVLLKGLLKPKYAIATNPKSLTHILPYN